VPSATLPKLTVDGVTEMPGCVPVPVSGIAVGEPGRFVLTEMLPEAPPAAVGANTALKLMLLLGASVWAEKPFTLKAAPVTVSDETTRFAVPMFLSVTTCVPVAPFATLPKLTLEGVTDIPGCVPVPLSGIAVGDPERLVLTEMLPETALVEVGVNVALKVMVLLGVSVCAEKPVTANPAPVALAEETVKFALPVFCRIIDCVAVVPSATFPKLTLGGVTDIPAAAPVPFNAIVRVGFEALLVTTRSPLAAEADVGANWT